jgi:hypothetical protein
MHPQLLREIAAIHNAEAHGLAVRRHALRAASSTPARRLLRADERRPRPARVRAGRYA